MWIRKGCEKRNNVRVDAINVIIFSFMKYILRLKGLKQKEKVDIDSDIGVQISMQAKMVVTQGCPGIMIIEPKEAIIIFTYCTYLLIYSYFIFSLIVLTLCY